MRTKIVYGLIIAVLLTAALWSPVVHDFANRPSFARPILIALVGTAEAVTADYQCDGVADDVEVQQAIDALPAGGGEVVLLAGTYNFTATVLRAMDAITIRGMSDSTYVTYDGSTPVFSANGRTGWTFADFKTDAGWVTLGTNTALINMNNNGTRTSTINGVTFSANSANATGYFSGNTLISTVAVGTPPLTVTSTTNVTNLNADYLDGNHASAFMLAGAGGGNVTAQGKVGYVPVFSTSTNITNSTIVSNVTSVYISNGLNVVGTIHSTGDIESDSDINAGNDVNVTNDIEVTSDADVGGALRVTGTANASQFRPNATTGTMPFVVMSTTNVTNLNADLLDGYHATSFALAGVSGGNVTTSGMTATFVPLATSATDLDDSIMSGNSTYIVVNGGIAPTGNITMAAGMTVDGVDISTLTGGSGNVTTSGLTATYIPVANSSTGLANSIATANATYLSVAGGISPTANITMATGMTVDGVDVSQLTTVGINFVIDGGGSAITTGIKGDLEIPFACTISRATALADATGNITVAIWKSTYAAFPPVSTGNITASDPVTISSAIASQNTTLTGWTTVIPADSILRYNVNSCSNITRVTISLKATRN